MKCGSCDGSLLESNICIKNDVCILHSGLKCVSACNTYLVLDSMSCVEERGILFTNIDNFSAQMTCDTPLTNQFQYCSFYCDIEYKIKLSD